MKDNFVYCKSGFNVIRIPAEEYNNKQINPENVEVLMWKNGEHVFENNDLSELICNEDNIFALEHSNKLDDLIDKGIENLVKEYKNVPLPSYHTSFRAQYISAAGKNNSLRIYAARSQLVSAKRLKKQIRKKNKKAYKGDLVYR